MFTEIEFWRASILCRRRINFPATNGSIGTGRVETSLGRWNKRGDARKGIPNMFLANNAKNP